MQRQISLEKKYSAKADLSEDNFSAKAYFSYSAKADFSEKKYSATADFFEEKKYSANADFSEKKVFCNGRFLRKGYSAKAYFSEKILQWQISQGKKVFSKGRFL